MVNNKDNIVFMSRNYRLIVAPRKFDVLKNKYLPEKRSFEGKYASFKNIKFPRARSLIVNYHLRKAIPKREHDFIESYIS